MNWIKFAESLGTKLKQVGRDEWAGPCPWCGGTDRFRVWERGNYWCRTGSGHCGREGWLDQIEGAPQLDWKDRAEQRIQALEARTAEIARRQSALEQIAAQGYLVEEYHSNLWDSNAAREYWDGEGVSYDSIRRFQLGYCHRCPLAPSPSHTIPVVNGGKLRDIRHRLALEVGGGKYRPHMAGLPRTLYNADALKESQQSIIIAEGEKKVIQLSQQGFDAVGIFGKNGFSPEWSKYFRQHQVYICLDPDAVNTAAQVASRFQGRGYVVELPVKADDFFTRYGGTRKWFQQYLNAARRV